MTTCYIDGYGKKRYYHEGPTTWKDALIGSLMFGAFVAVITYIALF